MKNVKRLLAFALTLFMAFAVALPAFADSTKPADKSITVNGLEAGDTVKLYKVIKWNDTTGWSWEDPFANALSQQEKDEIIAVPEGTITDDTAAKMGGAVTAQTTIAAQGTVGTDEDSWKKENLDPGLYMALITGAAGTTMHVYNPVFLAVQADNAGSEVTLPTNYANNGTAKKSDITVDKTAQDDNGEWVEATTQDVGDIIDFKVETTVPAYLDSWTSPVFTVTDTMSDGLTLAIGNNNELTTVTVSNAQGNLTKDKDYTINVSNAGYTISFTGDYLKGRTTAELVTITYKAKITSDAKNVNPETNTVTIDYSRNPTNAEDHGTKEDKTTHYTFSIDAGLYGDKNYETSELVKVGVDAAGNPVTEARTYSNGSTHNPLQGAEFKLFTDANCTKPYVNSSIDENTVFTTDENGKLNITGLDEGDYYLKETNPATGYMLLTDVVQYTITATYKDVAATDTCNAYKELAGYTVSVNGGKTSTYTFENGAITKTDSVAGDQSTEIKNTQGQSLPSTGGIGTTIFYIVGGVMVAGAAIFLLTKRRVTAE